MIDLQRERMKLIQEALSRFNVRRLTPAMPECDQESEAEADERAQRLELEFVEQERVRWSAHPLLQNVPTEADAFVRWFEALVQVGPGQGDILFPWLAHHASIDEMTWFLRQEIAGEAGFDDLVALTQVKMPARVKLELARNYWDEMGQGHQGGMHGPMLERLAHELGVIASNEPGLEVVWEAKALANLLVALASRRRYAYLSIGALGAIELTAPNRAAHINEGLKRLGVHGGARRYFALHATLDVKHSISWNREVLWPLVSADRRLAFPLAEGAVLRLAAGARCFERYRHELRVPSPA